MDKLTVGQELKVRVIEIDHSRGRISLSCKSDGSVNYDKGEKNSPHQSKKNKQNAPTEIRNNAFAKLSNLKLK